MKVAVLSGKGGTGKTLVSVNLASVMNNSTYIDCDVEEPNGRLFFKPENIKTKDVKVMLPFQDPSKCTGCKECVNHCRFNALCIVNKKVMVFPEVCHSCGLCMKVCETGAISKEYKTVGIVEEGKHNDTLVLSGILNMGEASGVPVIKELLKQKTTDNVVIDCPPGSACVVMESIKDADYCVLVAEPTIFGVSNLDMVYNLVKIFNKKFGVVLNKAEDGVNLAKEYCIKNNIDIVGTIKFDKNLGLLNSKGLIVSEEKKEYKDLFTGILAKIQEVAR